jgi:hypothetical protein
MTSEVTNVPEELVAANVQQLIDTGATWIECTRFEDGWTIRVSDGAPAAHAATRAAKRRKVTRSAGASSGGQKRGGARRKK